jgi:hypothetical protein
MARNGATAITKLSMKECKRIFRDVASGPVIGGGKVAKLAMKVGGVHTEFFTPEITPLSDLDDNPPDFSVGCQWSSRPPFMLHMYIWDQEDRRIVEFVSPAKVGARPHIIRKFTDAISAVDPACQVSTR